MTLPYKRGGHLTAVKGSKKRPIGVSRVKPPEIFVRVSEKNLWRESYALAHIRVRSGCYRYLAWREAGKVREFYLGEVRESCPTGAPRSGSAGELDLVRPAGAVRRVRKGAEK